ncbi:MAG: dipeptide epimerase, partial [Mesorhizobium sp.]
MARVISVEAERFPIAGTFTISRGSKTEAEVISCTITEGGHTGRGECVPYKRYGETMDGVREAIEAMRDRIAGGISRSALLEAMPAGAARNAVDCALWDLEAKLSGRPVASSVCAASPRPLETAYTLSLGEPDAMAAQARANAARPLLKVKIGGDNDIDRI